ncbi:MAG: PQQ-binding-like beta-propeller repeat protein [Phycisphaerales bacterium]|nr:PQQ-binding-like beta-propeller repeat protein [Phycisphaerales bacterium]
MNPITTTSLAIAALMCAAATTTQAEILLLAGNQGVIHQLDTDTGEVTFRGVCAGPVNSMVVHDQTLYLGDENGSVYAFDANTNLVTSAFSVPADASAMSWIGEELVVADSAGEIFYIDSTTHQVLDSTPIVNTDITAMGLDAGGIFVGGQSSIAVRSNIGQENFAFFAACGSLINSMAFGPDTMYLGGITFGGSTAGTVYLFDKFAGGIEYAGTHPVPSDTTAMVAVGQTLYIAGTDGIIHEMNAQTGEITRTFDAGINIQAMTPADGLPSCPADYDASGDLNFLDITRFLDLFNQRLVPSDTNGDSNFNFLDISRFISVYSSGC